MSQRRAQTATANLRPSERVMHYLQAEFDRPDLKHGSRLPTVRQLADRLHVSQPTVQGVLRKLSASGRIRTQVGSGTFLVGTRSRKTDATRLALSMSLADDTGKEYWITRIVGGIVHAAFRPGRKVELVPLSQLPSDPRALADQLLAERAVVDGLILFPSASACAEPVRAAYEEAGKPVVTMNPLAENATANFVSPDYFGAAQRLAQTWVATGRKQLVFLAESLNRSVSGRLSCAGFLSGVGTSLGAATARVWSLEPEEAASGPAKLLAESGFVPDAIYCAGDYLALQVLDSLRRMGRRVPEDVSLVGGTGLALSESACPQLTRTHQPFETLGEALVSMLCERIAENGRSVPARIVATPFMGGATTRAGENERLGLGQINR
jgi:DNA-binding LacI/PurR family transcriptional regulator